MSNWADDLLPRLAVLGQDKRLPVLATLLLIVMVAHSLAVFTWEVLPQPQVNEKTLLANSAPSKSQSQTAERNLVRQISQWHLFGEAQKATPLAASKVIEAPDTRLNLKLRGVFASSDPSLALAIIADGKGQEEAYTLEDKLPGNAMLKEIYADRVILEYQGRLEALRLPKEAEVGEVATAKASRFAGNFKSAKENFRSKAVRDTDTSELLRQYREAMVNDPQSLMNLVSATPVTDSSTGKLKGYKISPGKDRRLLTQFGLRRDDVVTAVNGVALDNPVKALEIMRDLSTASSLSLDVERKGEMQSFSFQID